jgi:hypothetical protein
MAVVTNCKSFGIGPFSSYILKWYATILNTDESIQKVYSIEKSLQGIRLTKQMSEYFDTWWYLSCLVILDQERQTFMPKCVCMYVCLFVCVCVCVCLIFLYTYIMTPLMPSYFGPRKTNYYALYVRVCECMLVCVWERQSVCVCMLARVCVLLIYFLHFSCKWHLKQGNSHSNYLKIHDSTWP